jgi:hypothetical protein
MFAEDDEDSQRIFARLDAIRQVEWGRAYIRHAYGQRAPRPYDRGGSLPPLAFFKQHPPAAQP